MADTGFTSPGTAANSAAAGTSVWGNVDNIKSTDSATASAVTGVSSLVYDEAIQLIKGGTVVGDNKASVDVWPLNAPENRDYGGSSDLWSVALTPSDVNASNFGISIQMVNEFATTTQLLQGTNFGFSVPAGATITGVIVRIRANSANFFPGMAAVEYVQIMVSYSLPTNSLVGIGSLSGIQSLSFST